MGRALLAIAFAAPAMAKPVTAVLRLKEKIPMEEFAKDVENPASPRYHKFYTPEEIRAFSAPSQGEYDQLLSQLQTEGFTVVSESTTHLWITVRGDSSLFENVFSTQLQTVGKNLRRPAVQAQIPNRLSLIANVVGLDNTRHATPKLKINGKPTDAPSGIAQATIKTAYRLDPIYQQGITGRGQHIAVATYMGFTISDVTAFYQQSNLSPVPTVDQVQFNGTPAYDENSSMETELDAEFTGMIAPGAAIHVFASATNDDAGEAQLFTAILDDNRAQVVDYSWGDCETHLQSAHKTEMQTIFARAVAQGVNVMVASGDSGSDSCQDGTTVADWPAAIDTVVAVGGTTFGQNGSQIAETAWSDSGGGVSQLWNLPSWQQSIIPSNFTMRAYPDVAFNADPNTGQAIWVTYQGNTGWMSIGGTSMAAPQWSGYMALVAEARAKKGLANLGFLPPHLYSASKAQQAQIFNDVTSGSNGAYSAGPGWDAVTGWGSMQGDNLLNYLTQN